MINPDSPLNLALRTFQCDTKTRILYAVRRQGLAISDLAAALDITMKNCAFHVAVLRKRKYVYTKKDPGDNRVNVVYAVRGRPEVDIAIEAIRKTKRALKKDAV